MGLIWWLMAGLWRFDGSCILENELVEVMRWLMCRCLLARKWSAVSVGLGMWKSCVCSGDDSVIEEQWPYPGRTWSI